MWFLYFKTNLLYDSKSVSWFNWLELSALVAIICSYQLSLQVYKAAIALLSTNVKLVSVTF